MTTASHSSLPQHLEKRRHEGAEMLLEVRGNEGRLERTGSEEKPIPSQIPLTRWLSFSPLLSILQGRITKQMVI